MTWQKLSVKTNSSSESITLPTFGAKKFIQILANLQNASSDDAGLQINGETGTGITSNAFRYSLNGGADGTGTSGKSLPIQISAIDTFFLSVLYGINIGSEEKLLITFCVEQGTAGAGNAPTRDETVSKSTLSAQITDVLVSDSDGNQNSFAIGSNLSALGTDGGEVNYKIQDGAVFEETDTNKHYIYSSTTGLWTLIT